MNDLTDPVDIYLVRLDLPEAKWSNYSAELTEPEKTRADRFLSDVKRREFTITRTALRRILSQTLDEEPARITIVQQSHGKPCLQDSEHRRDIHFSVSHSYDRALIAIARGRDIGVDVEKIRNDIEHAQLAMRFFSQAESGSLQHYDEGKRLRAFFATWTRKEAVVKAQGDGIALGLKQFDVSVDPDSAPRVLATRWQQPGIPDWTLINLDVGPDYAACLAVSGDPPHVSLHEWIS